MSTCRVMASEPSADARWAQAAPLVEHAIREYFRSRGRDADSEAVRRTIRINTELVPRRADNLSVALAALAPSSGRELDVLEVGCGFGALAAYVALDWVPRSIRAVDIRPEFLEAAAQLFASLQLTPLVEARTDDMRHLTSVPDRSVDLVVANNAFIYLTSPEDMSTALTSFGRVLRPGGRVLFFHANRALRDPFTKDPLVHLLPDRLARPIRRVTGWRDSRDRVYLITPRRLARRLARAGFEGIASGGFVSGRFDTGPAGRRMRFYACAARWPGTSGRIASSP